MKSAKTLHININKLVADHTSDGYEKHFAGLVDFKGKGSVLGKRIYLVFTYM